MKKPDILAKVIESRSVNMGRNRRMAGTFLHDDYAQIWAEHKSGEVKIEVAPLKREEDIIEEIEEEHIVYTGGTQLMNNMS